jgi:GNAT superfamily N-acetyltransferase
MRLPDGYSEVPDGKLASVVTSLEMLQRPTLRPEPADCPWRLQALNRSDAAAYRHLFRRVGADWLWHSRLRMPLEQLEAILQDRATEVFALVAGAQEEGLLELDYRTQGECELAFFGVSAVLQGQGAGRWLMNRAMMRAWARPIRRLWVHTCTLDHPNALAFYLRSGFRAYARSIEIADDPRATGLLPADAAPQVPVIRTAPKAPPGAPRR